MTSRICKEYLRSYPHNESMLLLHHVRSNLAEISEIETGKPACDKSQWHNKYINPSKIPTFSS